MVKLFKRKKEKKTANFRFNASIKIKDLPLEEYSHVAFAFQTAVLRFERMLKESLLEGYITSTTLERISQEFNFMNIRDLTIPEIDTVRTMFGQESADLFAKKHVPVVEREVVPEVVASSEPEPTISVPSVTPEAIPTLSEVPIEPTPAPVEKPTPTISFSFPTAASEPLPAASPKPETTVSQPEVKKPTTPSPLTPPSIPKISFPSSAQPSETAPTNPLAQVRGRREEDRATGIAILRKQMLTELKKIRSVVAEQDQ
ncbi:hypothetical protein CEE45_12580 [Candidatus Heimdallarchaeota archaeon B3_Heim]|nr:MAG: hypothetical protein CEE45_12580 [Candidatus Heimdallarchaeota archaeon B3_Heim]